MAKKGVLKSERLGEKHFTNSGEEFEIIEYKGVNDCTIRFIERGEILRNIKYGSIKVGEIKNPYTPVIYEVGYIGVGRHKPSKNNIKTNIYVKWHGMLGRCYDKNSKNPTYVNCYVKEEWHCFQNFGDWYEENFKNHMDSSWNLDKDILVKGNKEYSPETCSFVPCEINLLFTDTKSKRGKYPLGVTRSKNRFVAKIFKNGIHTYLGTFETPKEAFQCYKFHKELYIKEVANKWKNKITVEVYDKMMKYRIKITD